MQLHGHFLSQWLSGALDIRISWPVGNIAQYVFTVLHIAVVLNLQLYFCKCFFLMSIKLMSSTKEISNIAVITKIGI